MVTTRNRIQLIGQFRREEYAAAGTIKPGHLVEMTSSGTVQVHSTEGGYAERMVAIEDALQGNDLADSYSAADLVSVNIVEPGAVCYMYIKAGEDIAIGDELISDGDGTLIENGSETSGVTVKQLVAIAVEANDLTASGAVDTRSAVRFV